MLGVNNMGKHLNLLQYLISNIKKDCSNLKHDYKGPAEIKSIENAFSNLVDYYNITIQGNIASTVEKYNKIKFDFEYVSPLVDENVPGLVNQLTTDAGNLLTCLHEIRDGVSYLLGITDVVGVEMDSFACDLNNLLSDIDQLVYFYQNDEEKREFWRQRRVIINRLKAVDSAIFEQYLFDYVK